MSSFPGRHEPSSAALLRTAAAVLVVLVAGVAIGEAVKHGAVPFDTSLTRNLSRFSRLHPAFRSFMQTLTFFGSTACLAVVVCIGAVTSFVRGAAVAARVRVLVALRLVLYTGLRVALTSVIKTLVERPRPGAALRLVHATGWSFPSGHATNSTIVYGALVLWLGAAVPRRRLSVMGAVVAVLVAGVACSRLALGVHLALRRRRRDGPRRGVAGPGATTAAPIRGRAGRMTRRSPSLRPRSDALPAA